MPEVQLDPVFCHRSSGLYNWKGDSSGLMTVKCIAAAGCSSARDASDLHSMRWHAAAGIWPALAADWEPIV